MKFGVNLYKFPQYGDDLDGLLEYVRQADALGYNHVRALDHVVGKGKSHPHPGQKGDKPLQLDGAVDLAMFAWLLTSDLPLPTIPILTIEQLFLGGVLDRNPKLRFHFAETGIGW